MIAIPGDMTRVLSVAVLDGGVCAGPVPEMPVVVVPMQVPEMPVPVMMMVVVTGGPYVRSASEF